MFDEFTRGCNMRCEEQSQPREGQAIDKPNKRALESVSLR